MEPDPRDIEALVREKYEGDRKAPGLTLDLARLTEGEPLAYVIGHIPFLGLSIGLESRPLIPRPETEWWAEALIARVGSEPLRVLDLCAGSGAIGLAVLAYCPNAKVAFGELVPAHAALISENLKRNNLDASRVEVRTGDLYAPFPDACFDLIVSNPPYIPEGRSLPQEVAAYEPQEALYAGADGLSLVRRIIDGARAHLREGGELWIECDESNVEEAARYAEGAGASQSLVRTDQYGRPRLAVSYW